MPWVVKESDCPAVKSIVTALPSAVSAGQLPGRTSAVDTPRPYRETGDVPLVRGLQFVYVWVDTGAAAQQSATAAVSNDCDLIVGRLRSV